MYKLSEGKMEQVIVGVVAVIAIGAATFLGVVQRDKDTTTIITSVVTGLFGYAGMSQKSASATARVEVKEPDKTENTEEEEATK